MNSYDLIWILVQTILDNKNKDEQESNTKEKNK
jgi:hypothetical protein